jgi:hypothetical protein
MNECSETATLFIFPKYKIPSRNKNFDVSLSLASRSGLACGSISAGAMIPILESCTGPLTPNLWFISLRSRLFFYNRLSFHIRPVSFTLWLVVLIVFIVLQNFLPLLKRSDYLLLNPEPFFLFRRTFLFERLTVDSSLYLDRLCVFEELLDILRLLRGGRWHFIRVHVLVHLDCFICVPDVVVGRVRENDMEASSVEPTHARFKKKLLAESVGLWGVSVSF